MTYDDLSRYGHEILVPLLTSLASLGDGAAAVNRMVEYAYLDRAPAGKKDELVLEIVKVSGGLTLESKTKTKMDWNKRKVMIIGGRRRLQGLQKRSSKNLSQWNIV